MSCTAVLIFVLGVYRNLMDDWMHPGRDMSALLYELRSILGIQRTSDLVDHLIVHAIFAGIAKCLENRPRF